FLLGNPQVARRRALVDAGQQAGPEPTPLFVPLVDVEAARAEFEDLLQYLDRPSQGAGAGERPVELRAALARLASELDAGKILADVNLQVRKGLVVFEILVVFRLDVLDQPGLCQQSVDF